MTKFRKQTSPAFNAGELWVSTCNNRVRILSTRRYANCNGKWDWDVTYVQSCGTVATKNGWSFQVRYEHHSDRIKS